ncbi:hypothetical protein ACFJIW_04745 [Tahibacter sp. UC22_41]|uniref:hypothetical protein n=1 Tax=Tahibacter sp. UC22_41 TaxID=3350178 RepID=UPI0036DC7BE0
MNTPDFREIAHSGGRVTLSKTRNDQGQIGLNLRFEHARPNPASIVALYAIQPGIPVGTCRSYGIGVAEFPPLPNAFVTILSSDSESRFGRFCDACNHYWRDGGAFVDSQLFCPYCAARGQIHEFLTQAQRNYLQHYASCVSEALQADVGVSVVIDLDAIADTIHNETERPRFYYAEESQQNRFTCRACDSFNDVIGNVAYCSCCGSRNDNDLVRARVNSIRADLERGVDPATCLRSLVSVFDSAAKHLIDELVRRIPLRPRVRASLVNRTYHQLSATVEATKKAFDIDLLDALNEEQQRLCVRMFLRRHVHEHKGGIVDNEYIEKSGDASVKLRQALVEDRASLLQLSEVVVRMVANLVRGFHDIFPPDAAAIARRRRGKPPQAQ